MEILLETAYKHNTPIKVSILSIISTKIRISFLETFYYIISELQTRKIEIICSTEAAALTFLYNVH